MQTHELKRNTKQKKSKTVGRGGKRGKTSGRGTKGQNARAGRKKRPELRDIIKKIPKLRGRGVNSNTPVSDVLYPINVSVIEKHFSNGDKVTPAILLKKGIIPTQKGRTPMIKLLATGELTKKVTIADMTISAAAKEKVEKAGGKVL